MPDLNHVIWPGESYAMPKGWQIPTNGNKLRVGVWTSGYPEFMKVERDPTTNATTATGYAIDVFEEVLKRLPYAIPYEYVSFGDADSGNYNDFVYQVHLGVRELLFLFCQEDQGAEILFFFLFFQDLSIISELVPVPDSCFLGTKPTSVIGIY